MTRLSRNEEVNRKPPLKGVVVYYTAALGYVNWFTSHKSMKINGYSGKSKPPYKLVYAKAYELKSKPQFLPDII